MILVTGASNNHYLTLINFIISFVNHNDQNYKLIVYNLGLDEDNWKNIKKLFSGYSLIIYKIFDYKIRPDWFDINIEAGHYAWKPTIIYDTYMENPDKVIIWMDSGNLILNNLKELNNFVLENGIYSSISSGSIGKWSHPLTIEYFNFSLCHYQNRNGACYGFNPRILFAKDFICEFYKHSQIKKCIAPDGSSRKNHRQDQTIFSILYYNYIIKYKFNDPIKKGNIFLGYSIHNDVEPHWDK
jgi:hypothetical protein